MEIFFNRECPPRSMVIIDFATSKYSAKHLTNCMFASLSLGFARTQTSSESSLFLTIFSCLELG